MVDIVIFSKSGDDVAIAEMSERLAGPGRRLIGFYNKDAMGNPWVSSVDATDVKMVRAKAVSWGPAILSMLSSFFDSKSLLYLVDVDFVERFLIDPDLFFKVVSPAKFLAFDGRFDQDEKGIWQVIFPTWDFSKIAGEFLRDDAFRNFVRFVDPDQDENGRYYAERYFYTHFREMVQFECLFESHSAQSFHPLSERVAEL